MEKIEIPVTYNGKELLINGEIIDTGYTRKIMVTIDGEKISFEPDEERTYRPVLTIDQLEKQNKLDLKLLKAITEVFNFSK